MAHRRFARRGKSPGYRKRDLAPAFASASLATSTIVVAANGGEAAILVVLAASTAIAATAQLAWSFSASIERWVVDRGERRLARTVYRMKDCDRRTDVLKMLRDKKRA